MKTDRVSLLSVSDISEATGARIRSVIFWADNDVLRPSADSDRAGKGKRRLFDESEVVIASIAHKLALMGSPVGDIRAVCEMLRDVSVVDAIDQNLKRFIEIMQRTEEEDFNPAGEYFDSVVSGITAMTLAGGFRTEATLAIVYYGDEAQLCRRVAAVPDFLRADPFLFAALGLRKVVGLKLVRIRARDIHSRQAKPLCDAPEAIASIELAVTKLWAGVWRMINSAEQQTAR